MEVGSKKKNICKAQTFYCIGGRMAIHVEKKLHNPHAASLTPIWEQQLGKTIEKSQSMPDPRYGGSPYDRKINDHIRNGIINLNKPPGPTSHEVVAWVKKILNVKHAGHGGTLEAEPRKPASDWSVTCCVGRSYKDY